jgi:hypothetical protein
MSAINGFAKILGKTFDDISSSYYQNGKMKVPTNEELETIERDTIALGLSGRVGIAAGVSAMMLAFLLWRIPYLGPGLAAASGTAGVLSAVVGHDMYVAGNNLRDFSQNRVANLGTNFVTGILNRSSGKNEFESNVLKAAAKGTFILQMISDGMVMKRNV